MSVADQFSKRPAKGKPRGRPFSKGVSGNPAGRPAGIRDRRTLRLELIEALAEIADDGQATKLRRLCDAIVAQGLRGNVQAFTAIADRVDGRPLAQDEVERGERLSRPPVTVNILNVLGTLPDEALARLEQAAIEAEA